jgi:hypothetical protein
MTGILQKVENGETSPDGLDARDRPDGQVRVYERGKVA